MEEEEECCGDLELETTGIIYRRSGGTGGNPPAELELSFPYNFLKMNSR